MTKPSRARTRSKAYMEMHRKAGNKIYALDIDCVEYAADGTPLAIIETKHANESFSDWQRNALIKLGNLAQLPVFCVRHTADMSFFTVEKLNSDNPNTRVKVFDRLKFLHWLHYLHGTKPTEAEIQEFMNWSDTDDSHI